MLLAGQMPIRIPKSTTGTPVVRRRHAHDGIIKSQIARRQSAHAMHH